MLQTVVITVIYLFKCIHEAPIEQQWIAVEMQIVLLFLLSTANNWWFFPFSLLLNYYYYDYIALSFRNKCEWNLLFLREQNRNRCQWILLYDFLCPIYRAFRGWSFPFSFSFSLAWHAKQRYNQNESKQINGKIKCLQNNRAFLHSVWFCLH